MVAERYTVELAHKILEAASRDESAIDLDNPMVATIRSLLLLTLGDPIEFSEQRTVPGDVLAWISEADLLDIRGLLLETIHRWHELRRDT